MSTFWAISAWKPGRGAPGGPLAPTIPSGPTHSLTLGARCSGARARGFTAVELMLALALATIVSLAAFGLLVTVYRSDALGQKRFADEAELQTLQRAVRSLSRSMTCKQPSAPGALEGVPSETDVQEAESRIRVAMERSGQPFTPESLRSQALEEARNTMRQRSAERGDERKHIPPRFELRLEGSGSGGALPVVEALLTDAPVAPRWSADPEERRLAMAGNLVRGVIEGVRSADFDEQGWRIQWRPIEPPGEPVTLARRVSGWEWSVLPRKAHQNEATPWAETAAAWYDSDFPRAFRLRIAMMSGATADWMFEVPRPITPVIDVDDKPAEGANEAESTGAFDEAEGLDALRGSGQVPR
ncbi:MAG: type II secretion system protein J [Phycisphaerales bacterium]